MTIIEHFIRSVVGGNDNDNAYSYSDLMMCLMILHAVALVLQPAFLISSVSAFYSTATLNDSEFDSGEILTEMEFTHEVVLSTFDICLHDALINLDDDGLNQCKCYIRFLKTLKKQRLVNEDILIDASMNRRHDNRLIANLNRRIEELQDDGELMDDINIIPADYS